MDEATLLALADWSAPKEVATKFGPRLLRTAKPSERFDELWKSPAQAELKAAGLSWSKNNRTQAWEICWWKPLDDAEKQRRESRVQASKAAALDVAIPCPPGLNYLPFQLAGIHYLLGTDTGHGLNGDVPGLGKTIQFLGVVNAVADIEYVLVICPKTLKINWAREAVKWLVRPLKVHVVDGVWPVITGPSLVIVSYEGAKKHNAQIKARTWDLLGVDEAHWIKNRKTQRAVAILGKAATRAKGSKPAEPAVPGIQAKRHIRLTGTPIVNRPVELHPIIADLHPRWANFWSFAQRYCGATQTRWGWDMGGASNLDELQTKLRETIMVRRLKEDVLTELPRKIRQIIEVDPDGPGLQAVIEAERSAEARHKAKQEALKALVLQSKEESDEAYQKAVYELRQAEAVAFTEISRLRHATALAKVPQVIEYLEELMTDNDDKIIVAAHHHDVMEALHGAASLKGWNPVTLHGGVNEQGRQRAVDVFQTDPSCRLFVAGIQAAGVGITLTASSTVVFAEFDWVPGTNIQMEDRAHRIGQIDTVLCYYLVLAGSIDARVVEVTVEKQNIIDAALDKDHPARPELPVRTVPQATAPKPATAVQTPPAATVQADPETPKFTADQKAAILEGLQILAAYDTDRALERNGQGFNKVDGDFGHSLAGRSFLSDKQAVYGLKLVNKYRGQLPVELVERAKGTGQGVMNV